MKMRYLAALAVLSTLTACSAERAASAPARSDAEARYVGLHFDDAPPEEVREVERVLLERGPGFEAVLLQVEIGDGPMLWLTRIVQRTPDGRRAAGFEVIDAVPTPVLAQGEQLALMNCWQGDTHSPDVSAVVPFRENEQWMRPARAAWRVNRRKETLDVIPTDGVRCENEGWGV